MAETTTDQDKGVESHPGRMRRRLNRQEQKMQQAMVVCDPALGPTYRATPVAAAQTPHQAR